MSTDKESSLAPADFWMEQIRSVKNDTHYKQFIKEGERIIDRYRLDEKKQNARFNILWSTTQVLLSALLGEKPEPEVIRRFKDKDPISRTAAEIVERTLTYEIDHYPDFMDAIRKAILDYLLVGLGAAKVRFEPNIEEPEEEDDEAETELTEDEVSVEQRFMEGVESMLAEEAPANEQQTPVDPLMQALQGAQQPAVAVEAEVEVEPPEPEIDEEFQVTDNVEYKSDGYERTPIDYVYWKDIFIDPVRTWEEVKWVGYRVYMTRNEVKKRFDMSEKALDELDFGYDLSDDNDRVKSTSTMEREKDQSHTEVYEIWDLLHKEVVWVTPQYPIELDKRTDPLELDEFFPGPKPLIASPTNDTIYPVPFYRQYESQAMELDHLTQRIDNATEAAKLCGVYNGQHPEISRMLQSYENELIPVNDWSAFASVGGVDGQISFMPLTEIIGLLNQLYISREQVKQTIYEIIGISDIIRGATKATETLGAQQLKANFNSLRLRQPQTAVAEFVEGLMQIKGQMQAQFYRPDTLITLSGIEDSTDPQMVNQAIELLDSDFRSFRIKISTDTLAKIDDNQVKQERVEFLNTVGNYLKEALPMIQANPASAQLVGEMLLFGVRGFKVGRQLESTFEQTIEQMNQQPQMPPEMQAKMQQFQQQMEQLKQENQALKQDKSNEMTETMLEAKLERYKADQELQLEREKAKMEADLKTFKTQVELQLKQRADAMKQQAQMNQNTNQNA